MVARRKLHLIRTPAERSISISWPDSPIRFQSGGDGWRRACGVPLIRRYRAVSANTAVKGGGGQPPDFWLLGSPLAPGVNPPTLLPRSPELRFRWRRAAGQRRHAPDAVSRSRHIKRSGVQIPSVIIVTAGSGLIFWIISVPGVTILEL